MPTTLQELTFKYKLHEESVSYIKQREENACGPNSVKSDDVDVKRQDLRSAALGFAGEPEFIGSVKEFRVPSATVPDGIPIDVVRPKSVTGKAMILVFYHEGGMVFGSKEEATSVCKVLARDLPCIMVNVEYRLAPENKYPACIEDGKNVMRWVMMNKSLLGGVNDSKVGVIGCSAGGTVAAAVSHEVKGLAFQILVYPWLDYRPDMLMSNEFAEGPVVDLDVLNWCADQLVSSPDDKANPRLSAILRPSFNCLPPTLLLLAEFDMLKEQAYEYKRKLKEAGVDVESLMVKGSVHGFFQAVDHFKVLGEKARERIQTFLKKKGVTASSPSDCLQLLI